MTTTSAKNMNCDLQKKRPISDVKSRLIARVMQQTDDLVVVIEYEGKDGGSRDALSARFASLARIAFLLCVCREKSRGNSISIDAGAYALT